MTGYIYSIFNKVTFLRYIGLSVSIKRRFNEHKRSLNKGVHINTHLQNAWNKYGEENFIFQLFEVCDVEMLNEREQFYISLFMSNNKYFGYNLTSGGKSTQMSEETKKKMSISQTGKKRNFTLEHKANISKSLMGKKLSEERKNKLKLHFKENGHPLQGKLHPARKQIYCITNGETYESALDAGIKLNIDPSCINKICNLQRKQESGYRFIRIEDFIGWL